MTVPVLLTVGLASVSGLPEDVVDQDWSFLLADADTGTLEDLSADIVNFYTAGRPSTNTLGDYISSTRSRVTNASTVKIYDLTGHLDGTPHGSPIFTETWTLTGSPTLASDLPDEVAIRFSVYASGYATQPEKEVNPTPPPAFFRPAARYRGGFYFGPVIAGTRGTDDQFRPTNSDWLADSADAWNDLMDARDDLAIWSRVDATMRLVKPDGKISQDDAYDTIRKRGPAASTRITIWP